MNSKFILTALLTLVLAVPSFAQKSPQELEKAANIERLLKTVGSDKLQETMLDQIIGLLKPILAGNGQGDENSRKILGRFSDLMTEEFRKLDFAGVNRELYDKYFTNDEIKDLIAFYESPIGKKAISVLPALTSESMSRGEKLGQQAGERAFARLIQEFPDLQKAINSQQPRAK